MKPITWLLTLISAVLLVAGGTVATNAWLDIYGIFRDPHGRRLLVSGDERIAKYLLSERYVPANFDSVLIGSSVSANWKVDKIAPLHVYNDSLDGGNIVEAKCLVDQALSRPGIRVALMIVQPYLTYSHEFETVALTPRERHAALGSLSLWDAYQSRIRIRLHREKQIIDEYGSEDFLTTATELNPVLKRLMEGSGDFTVDPVALASYRDVVEALRAHGVQIVFVVPPVEERLFVGKKAAFQRYFETIRPMITPQDNLIDFTSDEFASFRADPQNFLDGIHLLPDGAAKVVSVINTRIADWIRQGTLRAPV